MNLKILKNKAHKIIDPFWLQGLLTRKEVYSILSKKLKQDFHIRKADEKTLEYVINNAYFILIDKVKR